MFITDICPASQATAIEYPASPVVTERMTSVLLGKDPLVVEIPDKEPAATEVSVEGPMASMLPGKELITRILTLAKINAMKEVSEPC